ncbi:hypothetical protein O3P69_013609 [Scylla paramamosain]|uniref:Uncharacterized protein n=1 Tax=Scylla paramamosain TaxID=85552 RepID=A0AAW0SQL7_SCYPA
MMCLDSGGTYSSSYPSPMEKSSVGQKRMYDNFPEAVENSSGPTHLPSSSDTNHNHDPATPIYLELRINLVRVHNFTTSILYTVIKGPLCRQAFSPSPQPAEGSCIVLVRKPRIKTDDCIFHSPLNT